MPPAPSSSFSSCPVPAACPDTEPAPHAGEADSAFTRMVDTWSRLVFSTAVRRVGDAEAAREIAQNVFLAAHRKFTSLQSVKRPAAWFHRAAMLESASYLRAERRRRKHLEAFAAEHQELPPGTVEPPEPSAAARVHLDEALHGLRDRDRDLVLCRFFEGLSFQELADRQGSTPDAVRVKLSRILEKLGAVLRRRGVAITAAGLSALFTGQWSHAAPAGLSASVVSAAGAGTTAATASVSAPAFFITMISAKSLGGAAAALLLAAFALHSQSARLDDLRGRLHSGITSIPRPSSLAATASPGSAVPATPASPAAAGEDAGPLTAQRLLRSLRDSRHTGFFSEDTRYHPIDKELEKLSVEEVLALLADLDSAPGGASLKRWVRSSLIGRTLARKEPQTAVEQAIRHRLGDESLRNIADNWISRDREGGLAALQKLLENPDRFPPGKFGSDPAGALRGGLIRSLAKDDLPRAVTLCRTARGTAAAADYLTGMADHLGRLGELDTTFSLLAGVPEDRVDAALLGTLVREIGGPAVPRDLARRFFDDPRFPQALRQDAALHAGLLINATGVDDNNPAAMALIKEVSQDEDYAGTLTAWMLRATPPAHPYRMDGSRDEEPFVDNLTESALRVVAPINAAAAQRWIVNIHDPARRSALAAELKLTAP